MLKRCFHSISLMVAALVAFAATGFAAPPPPNWMPGFPMRMATNVMLMWAPIPGATEYKIMRAVEGQAPAEVSKGPANNFMDMNVPSDKTFIYTVVAVVGGETSAQSAPGKVAGQKPMNPPSNLLGRATEEGLVMRWNVVDGAAFYNVYKKEKTAANFMLVTSAQEAKYTDTTLQQEKTYQYYVTAVSNMSQESKPSETFEFTVEKAKAKVEIKQFDFKGVQIEKIGEIKGETGYLLNSPVDFELDEKNGYFAVTDFNGYIQVFDLQGQFLQRYAEAPKDFKGKWGVPVGIHFDKEGNVWTTWFNPPAVRKFNSEGQLIKSIEYGPTEEVKKAQPNMSWSPADITTDGQGRIWIGDGGLKQIIVFDAEGEKELFRIGDPLTPQDDPDVLLKTITTPGLIFTSPDGQNVIQIENALARLKVFDMQGKLLRILGDRGPSMNNLAGPRGLYFAEDGSIVVSDGLGNMIKALNYQNGDYLYNFINDMEKKKYTLDQPGAIAFMKSTKTLIVLNGAANKLTLFKVK